MCGKQFLGKDQSWTEIGMRTGVDASGGESLTFTCPRFLLPDSTLTTAPMKAFMTGKDTSLLCLGCCSRSLFAVLEAQVQS